MPKKGGILIKFNLREGHLNDYNEISNLILEVHNLHVNKRPDVYRNVDTPFPIERFEELLNSNNTKLFIVEDADSKELIGYSILQFNTTNSIQILMPMKFAYIDDLCVKSSYQRNGIGKSLMKHIIDYAKKEGASSIQLNVWEFNEDAIKFYESLGMTTRNRRMELNI